MRKIKITGSEIVIFENNQNQVLEMFMAMKFDAECNETTPAIIIHRWHEDYETWGTHPADERGCEALSSPENTRNPPEIINNR